MSQEPETSRHWTGFYLVRLIILGLSVSISLYSAWSSITVLRELKNGLNESSTLTESQAQSQIESIDSGIFIAKLIFSATALVGLALIASFTAKVSTWALEIPQHGGQRLDDIKRWVHGHEQVIENVRMLLAERSSDLALLITTSLLVTNSVVMKTMLLPRFDNLSIHYLSIQNEIEGTRDELKMLIEANCRGDKNLPIQESEDYPKIVVLKTPGERGPKGDQGPPGPPGPPGESRINTENNPPTPQASDSNPTKDRISSAEQALFNQDLLKMNWFHPSESIAFRSARKFNLDYLWIKDGFKASEWILEFQPWEAELFKPTDLQSKKKAGQAIQWLHSLLEEEWNDLVAPADRPIKVARVEGRIVEYKVRSQKPSRPENTGRLTFDIRVVAVSSGEILAAIHHRINSPRQVETDDSLRTWVADLWRLEGRNGGLNQAYKKSLLLAGH